MRKLFIISACLLVSLACNTNSSFIGCEDCGVEQSIDEVYNPKDYVLDIPDWMPDPFIPEDNPLTEDGVELGRHLFFDPILSVDSSLSCASCHDPKLAFTDGNAVSKGVEGIAGHRSSMSLVNLAFNTNGFFWDGRVQTLEEQAIIPVEDPIEMAENWPNVLEKLKRHSDYPKMFRRAFGIEKASEITQDLTIKALAQFERTLISADSRYDRVVWKNEGFPTDAERRGQILFFFEDLPQDRQHPGCSHCHFAPTFTDNSYKNNGLDSVANLADFPDLGRGGVLGNIYDNGKFRTPSLRNIELTAPYMHDGRFATLEEVLDSYSRGGHGVLNEDTNIQAFELSERDKQDLIAFLKMLTDTNFVNNPKFQSPFE
ncbi:MAG: cytochrome c peroxidase [Bacteroidota bacterium]